MNYVSQWWSQHTVYDVTHQVLDSIQQFTEVNEWTLSFHVGISGKETAESELMVELFLVKLSSADHHDLTDDKTTLIQVMVWCRQASSHFLNKCSEFCNYMASLKRNWYALGNKTNIGLGNVSDINWHRQGDMMNYSKSGINNYKIFFTRKSEVTPANTPDKLKTTNRPN